MSAELITLIAAVLAGVVSIVGLVIAKESKISEFRQLWINDLRNSLVKLNKNMFILQEMHINNTSLDEIIQHKANVRESLSEVYLRINKLRPNTEEVELIDVIENLKAALYHFPTSNLFECYEDRLTLASASVLKKEWERVKTGEKIYRFWTQVFTCMFFITIFYLLIRTLPYLIDSIFKFLSLH
ncbi:hypothetical protein V6478_001198 [Providencia rettgeri]|uniref:hypothetical protein n=1 Tax=Providencia TaxID=586 RepID=UPI0013DF6674|nr:MULTISPECIES: hypothetical protein [Providencia]MDL9982852.1 hypothetical protein [Providencia rettgeri]QIF57747.1 hypothetical protein FVA69_09895 [Providencia sp. 1701011]QIF61791.1 hypothetical protein FVA70_09905 [Providencia sp. 1701091]HEC8346194.1 hypothetical protein [Providencia rettgeri]